MAFNCGLSPDLIEAEIKKAPKNHGYNFRDFAIVDMIEAGIVDPVKVTRTALQNAASAAGTLITTSHAIIEV
jgi:chaperonin GroEL